MNVSVNGHTLTLAVAVAGLFAGLPVLREGAIVRYFCARGRWVAATRANLAREKGAA